MDKWNELYKNLDSNNPSSFKYSDTVTYEKGFNWLKSCEIIEDWGCGNGGFKQLFTDTVKNKYIGIDGANTPIASIKTDLSTYKSEAHGIFMRQVLEYNENWKQIFDNACKSFKEKLCIVITSSFPEMDINGIKIYSIDQREFFEIIENNNCVYTSEVIQNKTNDMYNIETIIYITKKTFLAYYTGFCGTNSNISNQIPKPPSDIYDCYYYTNNLDMYEQLKGTKWIRRFLYIEPTEDFNTANFQCKHIKVCPHAYTDLQKYTYVMWLDSKIGKLDENLISNLISEHSLDNDMILRKHPWNGPYIWIEIDVSLKQKRYKPLSDQMHKYIYKQVENGLKDTTAWHAACTVIIRKMTENSAKINDEWYKHIIECGIQDQVSFFFVKQLFSRITVFTADIIKEKKQYDW